MYDLRIPHELGPAIARCLNGGYDNYFVVTQGVEQNLTFVARIVHPNSGRVLEVYSDQPGVQFSTANNLPDPMDNVTFISVPCFRKKANKMLISDFSA